MIRPLAEKSLASVLALGFFLLVPARASEQPADPPASPAPPAAPTPPPSPPAPPADDPSVFLPGGDPDHPKVRYPDGAVSENDRCIVRKAKLNPRNRPVYVNGRAIGFC